MRCEQALRSSESMSLSVSDRLGPLRSAGRRLDIPVYSRCSGGGAAEISGGSESMDWEGKGWPPPAAGSGGSTPGTFWGQNLVFWCVMGKKMCSTSCSL